MVDICGYELPTYLQNFTQKDFTEVKIFQKVLWGGGYFFETPCSLLFLLIQRIICRVMAFTRRN